MATWKLVVYVQSSSSGCDTVLFPPDVYTSPQRAADAATALKAAHPNTPNIKTDANVIEVL